MYTACVKHLYRGEAFYLVPSSGQNFNLIQFDRHPQNKYHSASAIATTIVSVVAGKNKMENMVNIIPDNLNIRVLMFSMCTH